jgi:CRP/FNR family transcriptional regulator, cyclic AMP receptor protein
VLVLPGREIPLSATVEGLDKDGTVVKLDLLITEYSISLHEYLTRVQLLDFVV